MKKSIALFLVITFMGLHCATYEKGEGINLEPGQKPGAKVIIQKIDGQQVKGELIAVKQNSLLLKESASGTDVTAVFSDMKTIIIVKKSKTFLGAGLGLLIGGVIGAMATSPEATEASEDLQVLYARTAVKAFKVVGMVAIVLFGMIIGGSIGALLGIDKTIQIEGKSDSEIKEILEELRKKARVPDFQ